MSSCVIAETGMDAYETEEGVEPDSGQGTCSYGHCAVNVFSTLACAWAFQGGSQ